MYQLTSLSPLVQVSVTYETADEEDTKTKDTSSSVCDMCGKTYKAKTLLYKHKLIHQAVDLPCELCQKTCKSKTKLRDHIKRVHGDRVTCNKCQKAFSQRTKWEYKSWMLMKTKHQYVKSVSIALALVLPRRSILGLPLRRLHIEEWERPWKYYWPNSGSPSQCSE